MPRTFKHLTLYQRGQIEVMSRFGVPKVKITKDLEIASFTLHVEINRGMVTQNFFSRNIKTQNAMKNLRDIVRRGIFVIIVIEGQV